MLQKWRLVGVAHESGGTRMNRAELERARLRTLSLVVIASVMIGMALMFLREIVGPLLLAVFLSFSILPLVDWLQVKVRLPRLLAVTAAMAITMLGASIAVTVIAASLYRIADRADFYRMRLIELSADLATELTQRGIDVGQFEFVEALSNVPVLEWFQLVVGGVVDLAGTTVLVLVFVVYMVAGRQPRVRLPAGWGALELTSRSYFVTKLLTSVVTACVTAIIMLAYDLDMTLLFAMLTFLLNFIPAVGSVVAVLLPIPVALLQFGVPKTAIFIGLLTLVQQLIGNVIEPRIMGHDLDLHPVTILTALVLWGILLGPIGMLLSVPLTVCVKQFCERYDLTQGFASLLSGRVRV